LTLVYVAILAVLAVAFRAAPYYLFGGEWPYLWNFMPVGALALFAGSRLRSAWAWLVPLGGVVVSGLLLFYPLWEIGHPAVCPVRTPVIYASFAAYVALGRLVRPRELSPPVIGGAALLAGVQFFVLTNFASWLVDCVSPRPLYTPTLEG